MTDTEFKYHMRIALLKQKLTFATVEQQIAVYLKENGTGRTLALRKERKKAGMEK